MSAVETNSEDIVELISQAHAKALIIKDPRHKDSEKLDAKDGEGKSTLGSLRTLDSSSIGPSDTAGKLSMNPNGYAGGKASPATTVGRPRALDPGHLELVLTLHAQDEGYRGYSQVPSRQCRN